LKNAFSIEVFVDSIEIEPFGNIWSAAKSSRF